MNVHGTALVLSSVGVLIEGASASGKTSLALAAIDKFLMRNQYAVLAADDQLLIEAVNGRLIVSCPPALKDLAEMRGLGIVGQRTVRSIVVDVVIRLVDAQHIERMPEAKTATIAGTTLPVFELPEQKIVLALPLLSEIIEQRLFKT